MRVGIDSYSYHRRYGEIRPGETAPSEPAWAPDPAPVLEHARSLGVDVVTLETCYLPPPETLTAGMLGDGERPAIGFSWGHPWPEGEFHGLHGGREPGAEERLADWIDAAARFGHRVMRITLGSPATRLETPGGVSVDDLVEPVRRAADRAADVDLELAIENHGDLSAAQLLDVIERAGRSNVGVTLDNVNLIRLGDDMVEGTRALAPHARIVQLKDHLATDDPDRPGGPVCAALGEGVAPLEAVLDVLTEAGFEGPVCVEIASLPAGPIDELAMIERSVAWLRDRI